MSIRTVVILLLCVLSAVFLAVNWTGIVAPVPVNLLVKQVEAPLGLIIFVVLGLLLVAWIIWSFLQQAAALVDIRKAYKEARTNKQLAENAEQSRIQASTKTLSQEFAELNTQLTASMTTSTEKTTEALGTFSEELKALKAQVALLDAKVMKIAESNGITLPVEEAEPVKKPRFFGLFGSKKEAPKEEAAPKEVKAEESTENKNPQNEK